MHKIFGTKEDKEGSMKIITLFVLVIILFISFFIVGFRSFKEKYFYFGKNNVHSLRAVEEHVLNTYGKKCAIKKKECEIKEDGNGYKFIVNYVMLDSSGLMFNAYQYRYGEKRNSGDYEDDYYYSVRDDLADRRIENAVKNQVDLSQYRTWDQIKENEDAADFTITYDRTNASESAETAARIFEANRAVAISANVISVIQDTEGNEIYRFTYSSLKEDLEKAEIDINNISEVHKYVEEKLVSCDSKSMAAKLCGNGN